MRTHPALRRLIPALALVAGFVLSACRDHPTSASPASAESPADDAALVRGHAHEHAPAQARVASAAVSKDLAALRRLTAPFHKIDKAMAAGWSAVITDCLELPGVGGMGFHYARPEFIDGQVSLLEPELLVYEPRKNGKLRLVAIEYIVPFSFVPATAPPPRLFGVPFDPVPEFQLWGLHAWIWRQNPSGIFFAWNPKVSCEFAP
jgi:hypothetical protein